MIDPVVSRIEETVVIGTSPTVVTAVVDLDVVARFVVGGAVVVVNAGRDVVGPFFICVAVDVDAGAITEGVGVSGVETSGLPVVVTVVVPDFVVDVCVDVGGVVLERETDMLVDVRDDDGVGEIVTGSKYTEADMQSIFPLTPRIGPPCTRSVDRNS